MIINTFNIESIDWTAEYKLGCLLNGVYSVFNGNDCTKQFINHLQEVKFKGSIFAHNGGKFDFLFLYKTLRKMKTPFKYVIHNGRIYYIGINTPGGPVIFKDSYLFLRYKLAYLVKEFFGEEHKKIEYTIDWFIEHAGELERHLSDDCYYLKKILEVFESEYGFGQALSIAGVAFRLLNQQYKDQIFHYKNNDLRENYYGGRVEIFKRGVYDKVWHYDVNSLYPSMMQTLDFPSSISKWTCSKIMGPGLYRVDLRVLNTRLSPIPIKTKDGSIIYPSGRINNYWIDTMSLIEYSKEGDIEICDVHEGIVFEDCFNFGSFVNDFYAKKRDNEGGLELMYKDMMNSSYGKFAQKDTRGQYIFDGKVERYKENKFYGRLNHIYAILIVNGARRFMYDQYKRCYPSLIYTDTDSIILSSQASTIPTGPEIGEWKESVYYDFEPISKKTYVMKDAEGKIVLKVKGFQGIQTLAELEMIRMDGVIQEGMSVMKSLAKANVQRYKITKKLKLFNSGRYSDEREYMTKELDF